VLGRHKKRRLTNSTKERETNKKRNGEGCSHVFPSNKIGGWGERNKKGSKVFTYEILLSELEGTLTESDPSWGKAAWETMKKKIWGRERGPANSARIEDQGLSRIEKKVLKERNFCAFRKVEGKKGSALGEKTTKTGGKGSETFRNR